MPTAIYLERVHETVRTDGRYPLDAYAFLHEGLEFTARQVFGDEPDEGSVRQMCGQQLCHGLRELALRRWGRLAGAVLGRWGITSTRDFGAMVYVLVEAGLLGKQESDRIEDFDEVFEFDEVFDRYDVPLESFDGVAVVES